MKKIYIASSWRNEIQPSVVEFLKSLNNEVYDFRNPPKKTGFGWNQIDNNWMNWSTEEYRNALEDPLAIAGFNSDFEAMKWADTCVLVLPCGRSANAEAGWMKGAGKKVFVYIPEKQEPELMYKMFDGIASDLESLHKMINMEQHIKIGCKEYILHFSDTENRKYISIKGVDELSFAKLYSYNTHSESMFIEEINVSKNARNMGQGTLLERICRSVAIKNGATNISVRAEYGRWTMYWYKRLGYKCGEPQSDDDLNDWIWMKKSLINK